MKIKPGKIKLEEKDIKMILPRLTAHMDIWTPQHKDEIEEGEKILGDDDIKEITNMLYKENKKQIIEEFFGGSRIKASISKGQFLEPVFYALKNLLNAREEETRLRLSKVKVLVYKKSKLEKLKEKYEAEK